MIIEHKESAKKNIDELISDFENTRRGSRDFQLQPNGGGSLKTPTLKFSEN
jgi:hypothetical protein